MALPFGFSLPILAVAELYHCRQVVMIWLLRACESFRHANSHHVYCYMLALQQLAERFSFDQVIWSAKRWHMHSVCDKRKAYIKGISRNIIYLQSLQICCRLSYQ